MADTTLSLPSLAVLLALSFIAVRYFFLSPSTPPSSAPSRSSAPGSRARPADLAKVEQISRMFPQLERRAIAWDLSRNGGSVGATTERVLERGGLDRPPPSYNPPNLSSTEAASSSSSASGTQTTSTQAAQDLISRYNLGGKVRQRGADAAAEGAATADATLDKGKGKASENGWASTKTERAALLAKRREDMILKARRDMEERVKKEQEADKNMAS